VKATGKMKTSTDSPNAQEARVGAKGRRTRSKIVEEFANYIDHENRQIVPEARRTPLAWTSIKPVKMNVDDATLACLEHDRRIKEAVAKTGHTFRDILKNCQLVLDGQPEYPDTWPIRWPCGFVTAENGHLVRAALLLVWAFNRDDLGDEDLRRRHDRAVDWMAHYVAGVKLTAEYKRRQAGGRAASRSESRNENRDVVIQHWASLSNRPTHERAALIAERIGITPGQVRRLARKAGLSRVQESKGRP